MSSDAELRIPIYAKGIKDENLPAKLINFMQEDVYKTQVQRFNELWQRHRKTTLKKFLILHLFTIIGLCMLVLFYLLSYKHNKISGNVELSQNASRWVFIYLIIVVGIISIFWMWFRIVTLNDKLTSAIKRLFIEFNSELDTGITWEYGNSTTEKTVCRRNRFCVDHSIFRSKAFLLIKLPSNFSLNSQSSSLPNRKMSVSSFTTILQIYDDPKN
ncbi:2441_t:CDS:2 [Ambispora leptoticha]|uniref:2441_t:CDS:1 n=1 Tax=Ambispora leptoticha TaxID=144679 RepID=A0A9N9FPY7_9GLOM|nr:2441_t:CDS:2 [Ambispora leptoticha]